MWSMKTNNIIAAILVAAWLIVGSNYIGNSLIPPVKSIQTNNQGPSVPVESAKNKKAPEPVLPLPIRLASANPNKGKKIAKKCVACHSFDNGGKNKVGPNLYNIIGRNKGQSIGYNYSSALKKVGGTWDFSSMEGFLKKPKSYLPGTKMSFAGLKKPTDRAAIILYLRNLSENPVELPK